MTTIDATEYLALVRLKSDYPYDSVNQWLHGRVPLVTLPFAQRHRGFFRLYGGRSRASARDL